MLCTIIQKVQKKYPKNTVPPHIKKKKAELGVELKCKQESFKQLAGSHASIIFKKYMTEVLLSGYGIHSVVIK